jgi:hypothetical protein
MSELRVMTKSEMLRRSMRCFVFGWWSLVPVAGIGLALLALTDFHAVVTRKGAMWNAARLRLTVGAILAGVGLLFSFVLVSILIIAWLSAMAES